MTMRTMLNLVFLYACMLDTKGSGFFIGTRRLWGIFQYRFHFVIVCMIRRFHFVIGRMMLNFVIERSTSR